MSKKMEEKKRKERKQCFLFRLKAENWLLVAMIGSVILGIAIGILIRIGGRNFSKREIIYLNFPGEIFMRMLKMLILPLIVSSLVNSLARLNAGTAGRLGWMTTLFFLITTFLAVVEGIVLVLAIKPGGYARNNFKSRKSQEYQSKPVDTILDLIRNLFPDNIAEAAFNSVRTNIKNFTDTVNTKKFKTDDLRSIGHFLKEEHDSNWTNSSIFEEEPVVESTPGMNILGLVMFSIAFGIIISVLKDEGKPLADFFSSLESVTMKLVMVVIWYGPIGITFLIAAQIVEMKNPVEQLQALGMYMATVIVGLIIHGLILLPIIYFIFVRKNPFRHMAGVAQAMFTAIGTDSSSATLPVTIRCMEENNHCDPRVARFVLPLGATVNMNGSALYEAVASVFIAQVLGRSLSIGQVVLVSLTATLAAVGAAGIPQAGLVTLLMVLTAVDLPPEYSALIVPVDWFLDRLRTSINVLGDTVGAAIINKLCEKQLKIESAEKNQPTVTSNGHLEFINEKWPPLNGEVHNEYDSVPL